MMIRFWRSGTSSGPISTPRSPRATMTASASCRIASSASTASAFSIFAITFAVDPACLIRSLRSRTSAAERTKDRATKSTSSAIANSRSSMSFRVSEGIGTGTPGRFTPLCALTMPPARTAHSARPLRMRSTRRRTRPSSISTSWPGCSTSPITAGSTGSSPFRELSSPVTTTSSPRASVTGPGRLPIRSFGPCRSAISASGRPIVSWTSRMRRARSACSSRVPWERLSRAASIPDSTSARTPSAVPVAGPIVATILVLRGGCVTIVPTSGSSTRLSCLTLRQRQCDGLALATRKRVPAAIDGSGAEFLLDSPQLVVLGDAVASCRRAGFDLARFVRDCKVGDGRVLGFPGTVRHHHAVAARPGQGECLDGLRDRPDLVDLDEDRVGGLPVDALAKALRARDEEVVSDELDAVAELRGQPSPAVPVVLGQRVLERDDRVAPGELRPERGHFVAAQLATLEAVGAVTEDLARRRIELDGDAVAMPRAVGGLEDRHDRRLARSEVRREAALVADAGLEAAIVEHPLERVVDLGAHAQRLGEALRPGRNDHELLEVDRVVRVDAAVDHV